MIRKNKIATNTPGFRSPKRVVVALRMAGIAGLDKLNGVFEHLSAGNRWQLAIYRTKHEFTAETVREEIQRGASGFIVGIPDTDDALQELAKTSIPTIMMNITGGGLEMRTTNIATVLSDSTDVGRKAAAEFLSQGIYKSYGYVGYRKREKWSVDRGEAFSEALNSAGFTVKMLDTEHYGERIQDKATIAKWLTSLPKPCGILAACDDRAFEILDIANEIGIKVPAEIGILGVNNDPILCENAEPKLSSIQPDFIGEGRIAAELLEIMMAKRALPNKQTKYKIGIKQITHRESTVPQSESGRFVQKVLAYINKNALKDIGVDDIAKKFKTSRSLLELRFRELQNESVYETILRIRFEEVKTRLKQTTSPIAEIITSCGWESLTSPKALFKKRFGMSMREYRKQYGQSHLPEVFS